MTNWRLLAERPAFDRSVPLLEVLRPLVMSKSQVVARVILHDPAIPSGHNWLNVFEVTEGEHPRFMSWFSETRPATCRYYVPAPAGTGFPTETPLCVEYRGTSRCRLCGEGNGHEAFRWARWEWPAGFRHYIAEHDVRPSPEFEDFINNAP